MDINDKLLAQKENIDKSAARFIKLWRETAFSTIRRILTRSKK